MRVRPAIVADLPAIFELERCSPAAAHWSRQHYENLLAIANSQPRPERLAWVLEKEGETPEQLANKTPEIVAFLVARRIDVEWELENIVVADAARRQGLGTLLLSGLVAHVRSEAGRGIFLEVRESNQKARKLYQKLGFEESGLRKNYYANPIENAILYRMRMQ
jgi:ribosomal-protein-alanine N-acetyltransferase